VAAKTAGAWSSPRRHLWRTAAGSVFARGKGRPRFYRRVCLGEGVTTHVHGGHMSRSMGGGDGGDVRWPTDQWWKAVRTLACVSTARGTGQGPALRHAQEYPALRSVHRTRAGLGVRYGEVRRRPTWTGTTRRGRRRACGTGNSILNLIWPCSNVIFSKF
jgi:hypothetical protein